MFHLAHGAVFLHYMQFVITAWAKLCDLCGRSSDPLDFWGFRCISKGECEIIWQIWNQHLDHESTIIMLKHSLRKQKEESS